MTRPSRIITKVEPVVEERRKWWARMHTDALFRHGRFEIAKAAEIAGYVIVVTIMCRAWERLLDNPFALSLLVSCLLFPSVAKKIVGKFGK